MHIPTRADDGNVVAVHNGIIENYQELKEKLLRKGYTVLFLYRYGSGSKAHRLLLQKIRSIRPWTLIESCHWSASAAPMLWRCCSSEYPGRDLRSPQGQSHGPRRFGWRLTYLASDVPAILKIHPTVCTISGNLEMARLANRQRSPSITWTATRSRRKLWRSNGMHDVSGKGRV